jgi:uncharacterized protein (TIGR02270 family)
LPAIPSIVDQHAQEAVSLALLRQGAVCAPHYSLRDLVKLDYRLDANLDGLRLADDVGWELCTELLKEEGAAGVFTAAAVAFSSGNEARVQEVTEVANGKVNWLRGIVAALGWLPFVQAGSHIRKLLAAKAPALWRVGLGAAAIHRQYPGPRLLEAIKQTDPLLKARALRAVGELGRNELVDVAASSMFSDDEAVRFPAAWSVALLNGSSKAITVLKSMVESKGPLREKALEVTVRRMELESAKAWQHHLTQRPDQARLAIAGAGAIGAPELITWLIVQMNQPPLARVAGEAFTMTTGLDIVAEHLEGKSPDGFTPGPNDSPEDDNIAMDEDESLPWPDSVLIQEWWQKNRGQFQNGTRYLLGKPLTLEWLQHVLRVGRQRQRSAAALELAFRQPGQPLFNVAAPGFRQAATLGVRN